MARLVDYQQDELGGYSFKADDGRDVYAFGPDAERLAAEIDRSRPMDTRLASNDQLDQLLASRGVAVQPAPTPQAFDPTAFQGGAMPPQYQTRPLPQPAAAPAPVAAPAPQMPVTRAAPRPVAAAPDEDIAAYDTGQIYVPPSAGRSAGYVPTGQTLKISESQPAYGEAADALGELSLEQRMLGEETAQREAARARQAELRAAYQLPELEMRAHEAQRELDNRKAKAERIRSDVDELMFAQREKRIDPERWFNSQSTGAQITTTIAQMLGAFGAALSGGENWAQKKLDGIIARDIAAQEQEIQSGQGDISNALQQLTLQFGDVDTAKTALELAMRDAAAMRAEEFAAFTKSQTAMEQFRAWELGHLEKQAMLRADLLSKAMGKEERAVTQRYQTGQAAHGGYRRPATLEEISKGEKWKADIAKSRATYRGGGVDPDVAAKAAGKAQLQQRKDVQDLGKALAETEEAKTAYGDVLAAAGLRFDPDTQRVVGEPEDIPGVGIVDRLRPGLLAGEKGRDLRQKLRNAVDLMLRARTGAAAPEPEIKRFEQLVVGSGTEKEFIAGMEILQRMNESTRTMHEARYGRPIVEQLESQRGDIEQKRIGDKLQAEIEKY